MPAPITATVDEVLSALPAPLTSIVDEALDVTPPVSSAVARSRAVRGAHAPGRPAARRFGPPSPPAEGSPSTRVHVSRLPRHARSRAMRLAGALAHSRPQPTSWLSLPVEHLRESLSRSPAWRNWTGALTASAARDRTYPVAAGSSEAKPLVVVDWARGWTAERLSVSFPSSHPQARGAVSLYFVDAISPDHTEAEAAWAFVSRMGDVIADLWAVAGDHGCLDVRAARMVQGPERTDEDEESQRGGGFYQALWEIECEAGVLTWRRYDSE